MKGNFKNTQMTLFKLKNTILEEKKKAQLQTQQHDKKESKD